MIVDKVACHEAILLVSPSLWLPRVLLSRSKSMGSLEANKVLSLAILVLRALQILVRVRFLRNWYGAPTIEKEASCC